jgi:excisionase family DNA binding protein
MEGLFMYRGNYEAPPDGDPVEAPALREIVDVLRELKVGQEEIRAQLGGRLKDQYTVAEVAELTRRAPYTVRRWIKEGVLRAVRIEGCGPRGRLLIPREEVSRLIGRGLGGDIPAVVTTIARGSTEA